MPFCSGCGRHFHGDPPYCEPCAEFAREKFREKYLEREEIVCAHCGAVFTPGAFEKHRWRIYYRQGEPPRGQRRRR